MLAELGRRTPLLAGADQVAYVDVDDTVKATYGYAKQGAGFGYSGVKGLNALIATVSTPLSAPVICATRLRKGSTNSARVASRLVADALHAAKAAGARGPGGTGLIVLRADSAFYSHDVIAAARRARVRFSITARMSSAVTTAISGINEAAWTPISYPNAVWDHDEQRLISDAEIAEIDYTAFTSRRKADHIQARLIVRRVKRLNPDTKTPTGTGDAGQQQELFSASATTAVFTDSPLVLVQAEKTHRAHAIIEQVHADLKHGPLAHLPGHSGSTPPGSCSPRSRSTSPAPPAVSPRRSTPARPPAPSGPSSSTCQPGSPAQPAHSGCACPSTGPGKRRGPNCSTRPSDHPSHPEPRPPPPGPTQHQKWKSRTDRPITHAQSRGKIIKPRQGPLGSQGGGSRLSHSQHGRSERRRTVVCAVERVAVSLRAAGVAGAVPPVVDGAGQAHGGPVCGGRDVRVESRSVDVPRGEPELVDPRAHAPVLLVIPEQHCGQCAVT